MKSNIDRTVECLKRAIEVVVNSNRATNIHIEVNADVDSIPTLDYKIIENPNYVERRKE